MTTPPSTLDRIRDLHERGLTPVAIAAELGADVTPAEVRKALAEMHLVANQRARGHRVGLPSNITRALDGALNARTALLRLAARRIAAGATMEATAKELRLSEADLIEAAREQR